MAESSRDMNDVTNSHEDPTRSVTSQCVGTARRNQCLLLICDYEDVSDPIPVAVRSKA